MKLARALGHFGAHKIWPSFMAASVFLAFWPLLIQEKELTEHQRAGLGFGTFAICLAAITVYRRLQQTEKRNITWEEAADATLMESPSEHYARGANVLARSEFGRRTIRYKEYRKWRMKNSRLLTCMVGRDGELHGFFDVFPLTDEMGEKLLGGAKGEPDINYGDILATAAASKSRYIYIASILSCVVNDIADFLILESLVEFLSTYYPPVAGRVYLAFDDSKEGRALLVKHGFTCRHDRHTGAARKDLYVLDSAGALEAAHRVRVCRAKLTRRARRRAAE